VRDLRVRWALEEAGLPYEEKLIGGRPGEISREAYRAIQPFGQVPAIEEDGTVLFESGAIVLYLAERAPKLLPRDPLTRAQVVQWTFAALNTLEPAIQRLAELDLFFEDEAWSEEARPVAVQT